MLFPKNTLLIPSSIAIFYSDFNKNARTQIAPRRFHSLTYRLSGTIAFDVDGKTLLSTPGTISYVPPGLSFGWTVLESGSTYVIHFITSNNDGYPENGVFAPANPITYQGLFQEMLDSYRPGRKDNFQCLSVFYHILAEIQHEEMAAVSFMPPRISAAVDYIEQHFRESELTVASLAAKAGISEVYFRKLFEQNLNMTPNAYINKVRIDNAKVLLKSELLSVTEIARMCGFDSISYFSDKFKTIVGVSPTQYKNNDR